MASSTQSEMSEEITVQLSLEEKECLDEIIKEAESDLESQEVLDQSLAIVTENEGLDKDAAAKIQIYSVAGALKNQTETRLSVMATHIWAGQNVKKFPSALKVGETGRSVISNTSGKGVEAAVVYSGHNKNKVPCAWLLSFIENKANGTRIYGKCGKKSDFINIDWKLVEKRLLPAGRSVKFHDTVTGTSLFATIKSNGGKVAVAAAFIV